MCFNQYCLLLKVFVIEVCKEMLLGYRKRNMKCMFYRRVSKENFFNEKGVKNVN